VHYARQGEVKGEDWSCERGGSEKEDQRGSTAVSMCPLSKELNYVRATSGGRGVRKKLLKRARREVEEQNEGGRLKLQRERG